MIVALLPMVTYAHQIEVANADGITIYYNYNDNRTELEVTCQGIKNNQGNVVIPEEVTNVSMAPWPVLPSAATGRLWFKRTCSPAQLPS